MNDRERQESDRRLAIAAALLAGTVNLRNTADDRRTLACAAMDMAEALLGEDQRRRDLKGR